MLKTLFPAVACFFCLTLVLVIGPAGSTAQTAAKYPVGHVVSVQGKAYNVSGQGRSGVKPDDPVFLNTTFRTGPKGKMKILFIDDTEFTITPDTALTIDEYVFDPYAEEQSRARFRIDKGTFEMLSGMITKSSKSDVEIIIPVGSIGIRGTEVLGGPVKDGYAVYLSSGRIAITNKGGDLSLSPRTGAVITSRNSTPLRASAITPGWLSDLRQRVAIRDPMAQQRMRRHRRDNIQRRLEYRTKKWPYKPIPQPKNRFIPGQENPFSDDFQNLQKNRDQRMRDQRRKLKDMGR